MWNPFKNINKDMRTISITSFQRLYYSLRTNFEPIAVNFEQMKAALPFVNNNAVKIKWLNILCLWKRSRRIPPCRIPLIKFPPGDFYMVNSHQIIPNPENWPGELTRAEFDWGNWPGGILQGEFSTPTLKRIWHKSLEKFSERKYVLRKWLCLKARMLEG